jgi:hypothetical protein
MAGPGMKAKIAVVARKAMNNSVDGILLLLWRLPIEARIPRPMAAMSHNFLV